MKCKTLISAFMILFSSLTYAGGFSVGTTRIIFDGNQDQTKFVVSNTTEESDYLVQSWVDNKGVSGEEKETQKAPFLVTPPLVKSEAGTKNELRVVATGADLPQDRESVYWVNVKSIPRVHETQSGNSLNIAVKSRIKLFYRPVSVVEEYPNGSDGFEKITFEYKNDELLVKNPTPFYVSIFELKIDGVVVDTGYEMVPPKGNVIFPVNNEIVSPGSKVTWKAINDYGAITSEKEQTL
ncbi:molecular chaperone [Vibrio parahaemolyticus]|uniref:fimbrial biogenesis chaperone n=1 Tax=Vibrio parahaemolyticus TaxID=670 RepID=UPI00301DD654